MNAIEPLPFFLNNGHEAKFFLNFAQIREAVKEATAEPAGNQAVSAIDTFARTLYIAMLNRGELTYEEFLALLPPDAELLRDFFESLKEHCGVKANEKYRRRPLKSQTPEQ